MLIGKKSRMYCTIFNLSYIYTDIGAVVLSFPNSVLPHAIATTFIGMVLIEKKSASLTRNINNFLVEDNIESVRDDLMSRQLNWEGFAQNRIDRSRGLFIK